MPVSMYSWKKCLDKRLTSLLEITNVVKQNELCAQSVLGFQWRSTSAAPYWLVLSESCLLAFFTCSGTAPCQFFFVTKFQVWCSSTFCTADRNLWRSPHLWEQYITVRKGQPKKEVRISASTVPRKAKHIWKQRQIRKLRNAKQNC